MDSWRPGSTRSREEFARNGATVAPPRPSRLAHICARTATGMAVTEVSLEAIFLSTFVMISQDRKGGGV
jgi:hypothetical protein